MGHRAPAPYILTSIVLAVLFHACSDRVTCVTNEYSVLKGDMHSLKYGRRRCHIFAIWGPQLLCLHRSFLHFDIYICCLLTLFWLLQQLLSILCHSFLSTLSCNLFIFFVLRVCYKHLKMMVTASCWIL